MHRYCCIIVGRWMLRDWCLYRLTDHRSRGNAVNRWTSWDRVVPL